MCLQIIASSFYRVLPHSCIQPLESQAASFSHCSSLFDIAAFKSNGSLQFKEDPTPPSVKETIKHCAVFKAIIMDLYTHKNKHTYVMLTECVQGGLLSFLIQPAMGG